MSRAEDRPGRAASATYVPSMIDSANLLYGDVPTPSHDPTPHLDGPHGDAGMRTTWRLMDGTKHRDDGPAVEYECGLESWYRHGELHREDGPASINRDDTCWYVNGKLHRTDGPARVIEFETADGEFFEQIEWWIDDKLHRVDGPARVTNCGVEEWWIDDQLHREDGPAVVVPAGENWEDAEFQSPTECFEGPAELYYLRGENLTEAEWRERTGR